MNCKYFLADRAYFSNKFCKILFENGIIPQIPKKKNFRKGFYLKKCFKVFDEEIYSKRSLVESVFSSFKRKFSDKLFSRKYRTKSLEISLKVLIYNINRISFVLILFLQIKLVISLRN